MPATRRGFMKSGALALFGTCAVPSFLTRSVFAQPAGAQAQKKRLVVIFQRGAADGLNIVVPHAETAYYQLRPQIAIPQNQVIDLDGFFGLHPAMQSFKPLYDKGYLAVVQASGSPDTTRSHFDAQDYMESGTPGLKTTEDGWLNRALQSEDLRYGTAPGAFQAVALGSQVPRTLAGKIPAVAVGRLQDFAVAGQGPNAASISDAFQALYRGSSDPMMQRAGEETFEAVRMLKVADPGRYTPDAGADYPQTPFAHNMMQIAQLLKADLGVEAAFTDIGGWDTHQNQGSVNGQLANVLSDFSRSIAAFWIDMGDEAENVVLVTMSEFGRTVRQNGTGGTDHGHANVMFVLGGPVKGGKVFGKWPGLSPELLYQDRDLAITTDFRQVLGEAAYKTLGASNLDLVFPGSQLRPSQFLGLL
jgi:uncharacterized protein (DUF1501 family)